MEYFWLAVVLLLITWSIVNTFLVHKHAVVVWLFMLVNSCTLLYFYCGEYPANENNGEHVDCLKTVAHIDLSDRSDLELVAIDYANDVAYYKYIKPEYNVEIGETVTLVDTTEATLVSVDAVGFNIASDNIIEAGLSGTAVMYNGTQIGYISSRVSAGVYRCVWN